MNKPYVKQFDAVTGNCINPIEKEFISNSPNRKQRRSLNNQTRFKGNKKGISLTINHIGKFKRVRQIAYTIDKNTGIKEKHIIEHYITNQSINKAKGE